MTRGHHHETARDLMNPGARVVPEHETLDRVAQLMRELDVGAIPVTGPDGRITGIITDRDIVVKCVASGHDPAEMHASDLALGLVTVGPDAEVEEALELMQKHRIRRLPVVDGNEIIGMITEADLARHLPDDQLAEFVHKIYTEG